MHLYLGEPDVAALRRLIDLEPNTVPESVRQAFAPVLPLIETQLRKDDDDDEISRALQCPYCRAITWDGDDEGIRVVDIAERWSSFGYSAEDAAILGHYNDDSDFETDRYECEHCGRQVTLPAEITESGF